LRRLLLKKEYRVPEIICENLPLYGVVVVEIITVIEDAVGIENSELITTDMLCINCIVEVTNVEVILGNKNFSTILIQILLD